MLTVTHTHNRRGSAHCNPHAHKKGLLTHHYVREKSACGECRENKEQRVQRTKTGGNAECGRTKIKECRRKETGQYGRTERAGDGDGKCGQMESAKERREWGVGDQRERMWENRECDRIESAGEQRVLENRECRRTESAGEQRVLENRECWRTESAVEQRVRENRECWRTESAGEQRV